MPSPFVSHSQSAICDALGLYATEATAIEHFEPEGMYFDPVSRFESAVPMAKWWSGTLSGFASILAPVVEPVPHVCQFYALSPSIKYPSIFGIEYDLTISQETISFPIFSVDPLGSNLVGHKGGEGISGRWRYVGLMSDEGYPIDDSLAMNWRWIAEWFLTAPVGVYPDQLSTVAQIEQMQLGMSDGTIPVEMSGRLNGQINADGALYVHPEVMWGNVVATLGPGKTVSGACIITRVTIQRDCSRLRMSADWVSQGDMAVAWS